jgi:hypothetical protein
VWGFGCGSFEGRRIVEDGIVEGDLVGDLKILHRLKKRVVDPVR